MTTDYRIVQVATFQNQFEVKSPALLVYVKNNPGLSVEQIATNIVEDEGETRDILQTMELMGLITQPTGDAGVSVVWHVSDWAVELEGEIQNARNWLDTHNNQTMLQMQSDLGITYEIAEKLGWLLEIEGSGKRVTV